MDPLYGQKALAEFSEYVVASLFEVAPSSSSKRSPANIMREGIDTPPYTPPLDGHASSSKREPPALIEFIAYALYRTRLPLSIVHQSLLLLSRLKQRYPSARGTSSSPHRLFLSALMLSAKISMDDTYSNKSWAIVGSNYFALKEVNQMERELFAFLGWNVVVQKEELDSFIAAAQVAFEASLSSSASSRMPVLRAVNAHTSPVHMSSPLATPPMSCPTSPQPSATTSSSSRRVSPTPSTSSSRSSSTESTSKRQRRSSSQQQQQQSEEAAAASRHQQAKNAARALLRPHTYRHTSPVSSRGSSRASSATSSAIGSPAACFSSHSVVHSPATSSHRMHPYALRSSVSTLQQQFQSQQSSQTSSTSSSAFPSVTHSPTSPASAPLSAGPQTPISEVEGLHVHSSAVQQQQKVQPPMHSAGLTGAGELDFPEAAGYFAARSSVDAAPVTAMQH